MIALVFIFFFLVNSILSSILVASIYIPINGARGFVLEIRKQKLKEAK